MDFIRDNKDILDDISKYLQEDTLTGYKKAKQAYLVDRENKGRLLLDEMKKIIPLLYAVNIDDFTSFVKDRSLQVGDKIQARFLDYDYERELSQYSNDWSNDDCNPEHFAFLSDRTKMFKYTLWPSKDYVEYE